MGQAGETPAVGKDIIGMADVLVETAETSQKALKAEIQNEVIQELRKTETKPTNGGTNNGKKDGATHPNVICKKHKEYCKELPKETSTIGWQGRHQAYQSIQSQTQGWRGSSQEHQWHLVHMV